jgi:hypothetical protein
MVTAAANLWNLKGPGPAGDLDSDRRLAGAVAGVTRRLGLQVDSEVEIGAAALQVTVAVAAARSVIRRGRTASGA